MAHLGKISSSFDLSRRQRSSGDFILYLKLHTRFAPTNPKIRSVLLRLDLSVEVFPSFCSYFGLLYLFFAVFSTLSIWGASHMSFGRLIGDLRALLVYGKGGDVGIIVLN